MDAWAGGLREGRQPWAVPLWGAAPVLSSRRSVWRTNGPSALCPARPWRCRVSTAHSVTSPCVQVRPARTLQRGVVCRPWPGVLFLSSSPPGELELWAPCAGAGDAHPVPVAGSCPAEGLLWVRDARQFQVFKSRVSKPVRQRLPRAEGVAVHCHVSAFGPVRSIPRPRPPSPRRSQAPLPPTRSGATRPPQSRCSSPKLGTQPLPLSSALPPPLLAASSLLTPKQTLFPLTHFPLL